MGATFADSLKSLRTARGLSQQQLAAKLFVDRSTVARWESGDRMPDLEVVPRIAQCLDVDTATLFGTVQEAEPPNVIVVDDERIALAGAIGVIESALPGATVTGFMRPSDALAYAQAHTIAIAFLDIEIGHTSGIDLCRTLLDLNPRTNVVFVTAHQEYSFDAWDTGACGFVLKPMTPADVSSQLGNLRYPIASAYAQGAQKAPANEQIAQG